MVDSQDCLLSLHTIMIVISLVYTRIKDSGGLVPTNFFQTNIISNICNLSYHIMRHAQHIHFVFKFHLNSQILLWIIFIRYHVKNATRTLLMWWLINKSHSHTLTFDFFNQLQVFNFDIKRHAHYRIFIYEQ